jgi:hypothetical protein
MAALAANHCYVKIPNHTVIYKKDAIMLTANDVLGYLDEDFKHWLQEQVLPLPLAGCLFDDNEYFAWDNDISQDRTHTYNVIAYFEDRKPCPSKSVLDADGEYRDVMDNPENKPTSTVILLVNDIRSGGIGPRTAVITDRRIYIIGVLRRLHKMLLKALDTEASPVYVAQTLIRSFTTLMAPAITAFELCTLCARVFGGYWSSHPLDASDPIAATLLGNTPHLAEPPDATRNVVNLILPTKDCYLSIQDCIPILQLFTPKGKE